jgi:hypothetical protein
MPTQPPKHRTEQDRQERPRFDTVIRKSVLQALGEPEDLLSVQVRPLWEDRYRVNIFVGPEAAWARIAHSYFIAIDDAGHILASSPLIRRQYGPGIEGRPSAVLSRERRPPTTAE